MIRERNFVVDVESCFYENLFCFGMFMKKWREIIKIRVVCKFFGIDLLNFW